MKRAAEIYWTKFITCINQTKKSSIEELFNEAGKKCQILTHIEEIATKFNPLCCIAGRMHANKIRDGSNNHVSHLNGNKKLVRKKLNTLLTICN